MVQLESAYSCQSALVNKAKQTVEIITQQWDALDSQLKTCNRKLLHVQHDIQSMDEELNRYDEEYKKFPALEPSNVTFTYEEAKAKWTILQQKLNEIQEVSRLKARKNILT